MAEAGAAHGAAEPRIAELVEWFEHLSPSSLERTKHFYATGARFKDPFNEVRGSDAIERIYRHMFDSLRQPRFVIRDVVAQRERCVIVWDFRFRMRRWITGEQTIRGASHLIFDADARIAEHRDYWDAAEELYEKLPLIGAAMRWLRRRAAA